MWTPRLFSLRLSNFLINLRAASKHTSHVRIVFSMRSRCNLHRDKWQVHLIWFFLILVACNSVTLHTTSSKSCSNVMPIWLCYKECWNNLELLQTCLSLPCKLHTIIKNILVYSAKWGIRTAHAMQCYVTLVFNQ